MSRSAAWRVPMVWMVFGLPVLCVLALSSLVAIAGGEGATDGVRDEVRRTAQFPLADVRADERALALGLRALLERRSDGLVLRASGGAPVGEAALRLVAAHPTLASRDQDIDLRLADDGHWRASTTLAPDQDWLVTVAPPDGTWMIRGRLRRGAAQLELRSALERP